MNEKPSCSGQAFWDSWDSVCGNGSLPRATKHPAPLPWGFWFQPRGRCWSPQLSAFMGSQALGD